MKDDDQAMEIISSNVCNAVVLLKYRVIYIIIYNYIYNHWEWNEYLVYSIIL